MESKKTKTITVIEKTRAREIPGEEARCLEIFAMMTLTVIEKTLARELHRIAYQNASFTICDISTRSAKLVLPLLVSIAMCASHVAPNAVRSGLAQPMAAGNGAEHEAHAAEVCHSEP